MDMPFGMDPESLREAPLFRELQRVMAAGGGQPINWELARQVGVATAAEAGSDPEPDAGERQALSEAVRLAELQVASVTQMDPPSAMAQVRVVRRAEWVADAIAELSGLIEPAAVRMTKALETSLTEQLPPEAAPMAGMFAQLGPLLLGSQAGQVLGTEAAFALGGSHVPLARKDPSELLFVPSTIASVRRDWSLPEAELRTWVAMHEVAHRFGPAAPWTRAHLVGLVEDFTSTLTVDVGAIADLLKDLSPGDPAALQEALGGDDALFGTVMDDEQRIKLGRVQAAIGAAAGWTDHVTEAVGRPLLDGYDRIEEALRRRREDQEHEPVFTRLLGIPIDQTTIEAGRSFCRTVTERTDLPTLARMWASPEALPSRPELDEPTLWLSRTV